MALINMKSNLSWYGTKPPTTDAFTNRDAKGFVADKQQHETDFVGIHPANYLHTGNQGFGVLGVSDAFTNIHNTGFTVNIMPPGSSRPQSQFAGIGNAGTTYQSTSTVGTLLEGYTPIADKYSTRFIYNSDQTVSIQTAGFESRGVEYKTFATKTSLDGFSHNYGDAKRLSQLGGGSTFPIGPEGQLHNFDKERFGFSSDSKYGDVYGVTYGNSGLADTYTKKSPIDDQYNKFNLRDDATPNTYIKHPLILRGIQRADNSDPQRFGIPLGPGLGGYFDIPRGGIVTAAERSALDAARIGKFLASPAGIGFLAKQYGYQLMNPNTENLLGTAINLPATQLYNPLSAPGQALVQGLLGSGKITRHSSLTNLPKGGGGEYGTTKGLQRAANILLSPKAGRMIKLYNQWSQGDGYIGQTWKALTAPKGPGSIFGLGRTVHTRSTMTDLKAAKEPYGGIPGGLAAALASLLGISGPGETTYDTSFGDKFYRWNTDNPYKGDTEVEVPSDDFPGKKNSTTIVDQFGTNVVGYQTYEGIRYKYGKPYQNFRGNTNNGFTIEDVDTDENRSAGATESPFNSDGSHFSVGLRTAYENDLNFDQKDFLQSTRLDGERIIYIGNAAGIRTNIKFTDLEKLLYSEEKRYYEGGSTPGDVDARAGAGDSPHGKDSLKERVGKSDFKGGGNNEPEEGQYSIFKTQNYEQLKNKASERQPTSVAVNNFLTDSNYNTAQGETDLEKRTTDSEFKGGGNNIQEEGQAANNEFETNSYEDIKNKAGERVSKPGERFIDNDFRTKQNYETGQGSTELEKLTKESSPDKSHIHPDKRGKAFDGGGFSEQAKGPTIDDYKSVPYASFPKRTPSITPTHHDFRDIAKSQASHGASGAGWDTTYVDEYHKPITENENSLINFSFGGIKFKAHLGTLGEAFAPGWDGQTDQGRADPRYLYTSFERTLSLDFIVAAFNAAEQDENWKRLQKLARLTYPKYGGSGFYGQDISVTIGDMFKSKKMIITDLGYDWDNETPWDITSGKQAPMYTAVNMSLTVLGDKPQASSVVYQHIS